MDNKNLQYSNHCTFIDPFSAVSPYLPASIRKNETEVIEAIKNGDDSFLDAYLYWFHGNQTLDEYGNSFSLLNGQQDKQC